MSLRIHSFAVLACLFSAALLSSCKSTGGGGGATSVPKWNPSAAPNIVGSSATPPHSLPRSEYPFDANGNYISSWVREGASKYGHSTTSNSQRSSSSSSRSSRSSSSSYRYHKVASGDTLYGLSRRYGTSVSAIKRANGMSSDKIVNGRTIKIPR